MSNNDDVRGYCHDMLLGLEGMAVAASDNELAAALRSVLNELSNSRVQSPRSIAGNGPVLTQVPRSIAELNFDEALERS